MDNRQSFGSGSDLRRLIDDIDLLIMHCVSYHSFYDNFDKFSHARAESRQQILDRIGL